ncbi:hypothetical protein V6N13_087072 [Hibiscus sabdariffa]
MPLFTAIHLNCLTFLLLLLFLCLWVPIAGSSPDNSGFIRLPSEGFTNADENEGVCAPFTKPATCSVNCFQTEPVCGVDGVTYWCGCGDALCAGTRVAKLGFCEVGNGDLRSHMKLTARARARARMFLVGVQRLVACSTICIHSSFPALAHGLSFQDTKEFKVWYFFYRPSFKYQNSSRINRTTNEGYWKPMGKPRKIMARDMTTEIGKKKTLVFYKGRIDKIKTGWIMHEYELTSTLPNQTTFVLCKLKRKFEKDEVSCIEECQSSHYLPPNLGNYIENNANEAEAAICLTVISNFKMVIILVALFFNSQDDDEHLYAAELIIILSANDT